VKSHLGSLSPAQFTHPFVGLFDDLFMYFKADSLPTTPGSFTIIVIDWPGFRPFPIPNPCAEEATPATSAKVAPMPIEVLVNCFITSSFW
jgi:hypothetical protein